MASTNTNVDVGINLAGTNYWNKEYPFINRIKDSGNWIVYYKDGTSGYAPASLLDANGDLTTLPANAKSAGFAFAFDPLGEEMTDRYVLTYEGTAKMSIAGVKIISSAPGKIVFEVTKDGSWTSLSVTSADHLSNMAIVREDQVALYEAGEIFNPAFVAKIDDFSTLRFMDWGATNDSKLADWADRPLVTDRSWQKTDGGAPIEVMVALANKTHNDMWINIPFHATDDFVRQELTYIRDHLDPDLKVKVEYSNEVWNFGFQQAKDAMAIADTLWGTDVNKDGRIDPNDAKEHVADGWRQYYGYRAAQVAAVANTVFTGAEQDRLENVLSARGINGTTVSIANGIAKANVGTITALFDVMSTDGYFGNFGGIGTKADLAKVLEWAKGGAAGLDAAFDELYNGGSLSVDMSIKAIIAKFAGFAKMANTYGLDLVAYEGGLAVLSTDFAKADQPIVADFYKRLADDPRMGDLYTRLIKGFEAAGGTEFVAFNDAATPVSNGAWGALEHIYQDGSMRYDALIALARAGAAHAAETIAPGIAELNAAVGILGTAGADTLKGTDGDDLIDGREGSDTMTGGLGNDTYVVDSSGDRIVEKAGQGRDAVRTSLASFSLAAIANVEDLTFTGTGDFRGTGNGLDNAITGGAGNDTLSGGDGADTLIGGDGNDTLNGGAGIDRMVGGKGDDVYLVDDPKDMVIENNGEGTDVVRTSVSFSLVGLAVENLDATGTALVSLTGNALDNVIRGNDAINTIAGGAGDDLIRGYGGSDTLRGDDGDDSLYGGDGNDVLIGGAGRDVMRGEAGNDVFRFLSLGDTTKVAAGSDFIADFEKGDRIDLSAIDANSKLAGDQAFKFVGTAAFTGQAGELHVEKGASYWLLSGDVDGDKLADFCITVAPAIPLASSNFIL